MNIYLVVEGVTEAKVYPEWIQFINGNLKKSRTIDEVTQNNFYLISGLGYPNIKNIIENAVLDTNTNLQFDRLVISLDSENFDLTTRYQEIDLFVKSLNPRVEVKIIIQHFCFETWALGNEKIGPRKPKNSDLVAYKAVHDVSINDPELLPAHMNLNRSQFAFKYLKLAIRDKGSHITYSKNDPSVVAHPKYFNALIERLQKTGHIASFDSFLNAFI